MPDPLDIIRKLIALALNNPSEEEARSAALRAVRMIDQHNIIQTVSGTVRPNKPYTPDPDFESWWSNLKNPDISAEDYPSPEVHGELKVAAVEEGIDDQYMRKNIQRAWKAIRKERERLERDIQNHERNHYTRYNRPDWKSREHD